MDSDSRDQIIEQSRKQMHRHVKRVYDRPCSCANCKRVSVQANTCIGFQCRYCSKYNSAEEAFQRFNDGDYVEEESKRGDFNAPSFTMNGEYKKFRDEHEIRADLYANGIRRDTVGVDKFNRVLKKELTQNKCYRGQKATGV
jgi:hypothetical protein